MKVIIRDENGIEDVLYEYKYEPSTPKSSIFLDMLVYFLMVLSLIGFIFFILFVLKFFLISILLFAAFIFILNISNSEIEPIIIDTGIKSVIVTYKHNYKKNKTLKAIKFSDIKEVNIKDSYDYEYGDFRHITLVKSNEGLFNKNWLNERVDTNQFTKEMGIKMSKIIGVNCYYLDKDKLTLLNCKRI